MEVVVALACPPLAALAVELVEADTVDPVSDQEVKDSPHERQAARPAGTRPITLVLA